MRIYDLMTNHLTNPLGFTLDAPRLSYKVDDTTARRQAAAQIRIATDADMRAIVHDSGRREDIDSLCYTPGLALAPRTRYWWCVTVWADNGETVTSAPAWFETGKMDEPWRAEWITADIAGNMCLSRDITLDRTPVSARVYATGVGLYELYIDGEKVGDELLAPFCNAYDAWIQVQTYDPGMLTAGAHVLRVMLGDGWYKGPFGFEGKTQLYGDTQALRLELRLRYADGSEEIIATDERWQATDSAVRDATIYDGETYDATYVPGPAVPAIRYHGLDGARLMDRLSPPVRVTQRLAPREIITTPAGETVLDLGQEITGYIEFRTRAPKGARLSLYYSEILQHGNFYRDNLRTALAEYHYIANGTEAIVRPYFTFYGFRYVKLEGFDNPQIADFTGCVVHSDIPLTSTFSCSNEKVNRLAQNVIWGQRGNFLDVPTDCPQRDERMGWTGDAQAFSGTACFQMDSAAFFTKYLYDMQMEQDKRGGAVPHVVPAMTLPGEGSCAWADAAAIIPWNLYLFYGDKALLATQYSNMRDWVEWIYRVDEASGGTRLWHVGFHFADWLALDTKDGTPMGGTDPYFIATAYYYYVTTLLLKAARALDYADDIRRYETLAGEIFDAIQREYFTPAGRLAQTTQTGYICALFMRMAKPENEPLLAQLLAREFEQTHSKLRTGFVGTAYLCRTLTQAGLNTLAYRLLLNEEYPGWLYEVNMGATTVWERWNSVLPDGMISDTGMNSLNHYAYGAVMEWVFRDVAGLNPVEDAPGFRRALLRPRPESLLPEVSLVYESAVGQYASEWRIDGRTFTWHIRIPFGATATAVFPHADAKALAARYPQHRISEVDGEVIAELEAGDYTFTYEAIRLFTAFSMGSTLAEVMAYPPAMAVVKAYVPDIERHCQRPDQLNRALQEVVLGGFSRIPPDDLARFTDALAAIE